MNFDEYQKRAKTTAIYPDVGFNIVYPTLGLNGEAGEIAEKVKKYIRDGGHFLSLSELLLPEIGDALWYIAALCSELDISMNDVAENNLAKLQSRVDRNKLHGSGDDR